MTTDIIYAANVPDGYLQSNNADYATCRAGSGLQVVLPNVFGPIVGGTSGTIEEAFEQWDTSGIGTDIISSAVLALYSSGYAYTGTIQARAYDWGTGLTTGDWVPGANLSALTLVAHLVNPAAYYYQNYTDDALAANINKTGSTRLILVTANLVAGTPDTAYGSYHGATGTAYDPKLTITHAPASTAYTATAGDSVATLTDALARGAAAKARTTADSASTLTDAVARAAMAKARTGADSVATLTEAVARAAAKVRMSADSIASLAEAASRAGVFARSSADSIGTLADAVVRAAMAKARTAADSASSLSEATARLGAFARSGADSIGSLTEAVARAGVFGRTVGDTIGSITEAVVAVKSGVQHIVATVGDSISSLSETASRAGVFARSHADSISTLVESAVRAAAAKARTGADAVSAITEGVVAIKSGVQHGLAARMQLNSIAVDMPAASAEVTVSADSVSDAPTVVSARSL
jgi:hypothetical protein